MYKIETAHHIIETSDNEKPAFTCNGVCKSVWWMSSFPDYNPMMMICCPKCGGKLRTAHNDDYIVIEHKFTTNEIKKGYNITLKHTVKEGSEELAKKTWC